MIIPIDIFGSSYEHRSKKIGAQECTNFYQEVDLNGGKGPLAIIGTPGLELFATVPVSGGNRGMYKTSTGRMFVVVGKSLYEASADATLTSIGSLLTSAGTVSFADNGVDMILVDGTSGYTLILATDVFSEIADPDFPDGATHVQFMVGYYIVNDPSKNQYNAYFSALYDGTTWSAADVFSAEGSPDKLIAISKTNNELFMFGDQSVEVFYPTGDADLPFQRIQGAFIDIGTSAKYSIATNGSTVFWLGSNAQGHGVVWMAQGYIPTRISTHAIEYQISEISRIDDAIGYCYQQEGHRFYVINFQAGNKTFVFDVITGQWHERGVYNEVSGYNDRQLGLYHTNFQEKDYVGDYSNGNIYELSLDVYTDNGETIKRIKTSNHIYKDNRRIFYHYFEIVFEPGVGITTGQGSDPQAMLQWSDDGGFTWSSEYWTTIGKIGEYKNRARWRRLGFSRDRIFRVVISDPVKSVIVDARAGVEIEA